MIQALKHMSIRLWMTLLLGSVAILSIFPALNFQIGLEWAFMVVAPIFLLVFYLMGWLLNRLGAHIVKRMVTEAAIWERAGKTIQAEKLLRKALAVFDCFLISPFSKNKQAPFLTGHMARFYLAQADNSRVGRDVIAAHLQMNPNDRPVVESWLQKLEDGEYDLKTQADLLPIIAEAQLDDAAIQITIARHYLLAERADFQALQTYRRLIQDKTTLDKNMVIQMADLFLEKRHTNTTALQIYLMAYRQYPQKRLLIKAVAACLHGKKANGAHKTPFKEARKLLSKYDQETLEQMASDFIPTTSIRDETDALPRPNFSKTAITLSKSVSGVLINTTQNVVSYLRNLVVTLYNNVRNFPYFKSLIKWSAVSLAILGLIVLVANTAGHLMRSKPETKETDVPQTVVVTDPYTLQVAAYLKSEHAEKYVTLLKDQGLDAYWTEAIGAQKNWYQVRVSHFADKASARAYGEKLKARGIIDDFYVANYERP